MNTNPITASQVQAWQEEAKFRYPHFDLKFETRQSSLGWECGYYFEPLPDAPLGKLVGRHKVVDA